MYGARLTIEELELIFLAKKVDLFIWTDLLESQKEGFSIFNFYPELRGFDQHPSFKLLDRIADEQANIVEIYAFDPSPLTENSE